MHADKFEQQRYQNRKNNAQGHIFEEMINNGCAYYKRHGKAAIDKTPEPFRVMKKNKSNGTFTGRFTSLALPDYQGTLHTGRSIVFEAKYTTTDQIKRNVLTQNQMDTLEHHHKMNAVTAVCVGIQQNFYFIPWTIWREMKAIYGRQYLTRSDINRYSVKFNGAVLFLDSLHRV